MDAASQGGWPNIIHFSTGRDWEDCGSRYPYAITQSNANNKIVIASCVSDNTNYYQPEFTLNNDWNSITIGQEQRIGDNGEENYVYFYKHNGVTIHEVINSNPIEIDGLNAYVSDPWYPAANVNLRNLIVRTDKKAKGNKYKNSTKTQ